MNNKCSLHLLSNKRALVNFQKRGMIHK